MLSWVGAVFNHNNLQGFNGWLIPRQCPVLTEGYITNRQTKTVWKCWQNTGNSPMPFQDFVSKIISSSWIKCIVIWSISWFEPGFISSALFVHFLALHWERMLLWLISEGNSEKHPEKKTKSLAVILWQPARGGYKREKKLKDKQDTSSYSYSKKPSRRRYQIQTRQCLSRECFLFLAILSGNNI